MPLIMHYQQRLHTRGPTVAQNNEDLVAPNPQMMRTMQDWRSGRKGKMTTEFGPPGEIDEGIHQFIMT